MKVDKDAAKKYAKALLELAQAEKYIDKVEDDLLKVIQTISNHLELKDTLKNKALEINKKKAILEDIFTGEISDLSLYYLILLISQGKNDLLPDLLKEYKKLAAEIRGKTVAEVITVVPLPKNRQNLLAERLKEIFGKDVLIKNRVDSTILGGIQVKVEGKLIDASIRNQLEDLREKMIAGGED